MNKQNFYSLKEIAQRVSGDLVQNDIKCDIQNILISDLATHTEHTHDHSLFVAPQTVSNDRNQKLVDIAIKNNSPCIITSQDTVIKAPILIKVSDIQKASYILLNLFYPQKVKYLSVITGTNGKSSCVNFVQQIWQNIGYKSASIGTLGIRQGNHIIKSELTTPNNAEIRRQLHKLSHNSIQRVAIEASSHGLSQGRLEGCNISSAAFTNLSHDHLDYHKNILNYYLAKESLFIKYSNDKTSFIINADDEWGKRLITKLSKFPNSLITYGKKGKTIQLIRIKQQAGLTQEFSFVINGKVKTVQTKLIGEFQVYNLLCAICIVLSNNIKSELITPQLLKNISSARGRMEIVGKIKQAIFIIDYAHTPDALKNILLSLKKYPKISRLIIVFGAGGDRDKSKRKEMGKICDELADISIVTDDNPRFEDPSQIRQEVMELMSCPIEIGNRYAAIKYASKIAQPNDVILIAGKGHEEYQLIKGEKLHHSDHEAILKLDGFISSTFL